MRAIKLPSAADDTCLSRVCVPALKMATVASAIGLPASSRTTPRIVPRVELLSMTVSTDGRGVAHAAAESAVTISGSTHKRLVLVSGDLNLQSFRFNPRIFFPLQDACQASKGS